MYSDPTALRTFYNVAPPRIISGVGSFQRLESSLDELGVRRCFGITGMSIINKTDLVERVSTACGSRWVGVFSGVQQHVPSRSVIEAAAAAREADADTLIAIGGGSPIDASRVCAAIMVSEEVLGGGEVLTGADVQQLASRADPAKMPKIVTISTTLSGAEWTPYAGVTDERTQIKTPIRHPSFTPSVAILSPEITLQTPLDLWLSTGMRSVDHAVESLYSERNHPLIELLAAQALRVLTENLVQTVEDPEDLSPRAACQMATWFSFFSLDTVMIGPSHALGHQVGSLCNVPHGITSCILLPPVIRFLRRHNAPRLRLVAEALGVTDAADSNEEAALKAEMEIRSLVQRLGLPSRLRDVGVSREDLPRIAGHALQEPIGMMRSSGVTIEREEQLIEILMQAY